MADQDGLRFLFDIQDKITAKLIKIEAKSKASADKINSAFTKASRAQEANAAKVIHTSKLRGIAVEAATAKATAARSKETAQGKILAQRLSAAQSREARQAANFRIAAVRRAQMASDKAERAIAAASKARARVAIKAEKDHERATKARAREQQRASEKSAALARKSILVLSGFAAALAATSVKLVALGSDAEETENVTGLAFGEMKGAAEKWAASFAAATGSSKFESIELVSDLGLIVKGMGFTEEASLGMSSRMVELAADMASAKNVPLDVALDKIRAGLIGESEPLRTMGVLLSEARVKQEAYTSGLAETGSELTNTQKVQARMNIILADSAAMHGDLINTQGSVANQWRAIKNRVFDAATALGQKLLPAAGEVLGVLSEWVTKGADLITWITESEWRMKAFGAILAGVVVTGLGLAAAALWAMVPAIAGATGGISLLLPLIAVSVGALVAGWVLFGDTIKNFLRAIWNKFLDNIGIGLKHLSKFVGIFSDDWGDALEEAGESLQDTSTEMGKTEKATEKLAKKQVAAIKVTEKVTEEQKAAAKAARKSAEAVQGLLDAWTGATLKSGEFLKAFSKLTPAQRDNDRIMKQVIQKYGSMREILGPFDTKLEALWKTTEELNKKLKAEEKAQKAATKAQEAAKKAAEDLNARLEAQRLRLLGLPTEAVKQAFEELTTTWEGLNEAEREVATQEYTTALIDAAAAGNELNAEQVELIASSGILTKAQEAAKKAAEDLNARLEAQRLRLLGLPTEAAITSFEELTTTWEGLNEAEREVATKEYAGALIDASESGHTLNDAQLAIIESTQDATQEASGYELALAGMAGQMGGATGQALNLVIAMREHNKEQKLAAALGKKTEASFGKMRMGAAGMATAFSAIGDAVGGTAGKVLKELSGIAKAFATGGLVAGIIAGIMALGKAIWGLFTKGKKKREAARKKEAAAAKKVADAAKAAADTHAEAVEGLRLAWLNLPTEQIVLDLTAIRDAWDALGVDDRTTAFEDYVASLISARDAGAELTAVELNLVTLFEEHQQQRTAMLARHKAEMAGFDTQIAALESLLQTKISEVDALIAQQEAEMEALTTRQDAEMEALATRRQAALDSIMAAQNAQLSLLKETQQSELDAMRSAQEAELSALKAARNAQLSVVESAIQRELEDERIGAQLTIDLRKAGGDQEAIDAAHARAATSTERLLERDELNDLMAEAEARVRARYQNELDELNKYWDAKEENTTERFQVELASLERAHTDQMTALENAHANELQEHNTFFDHLEKKMSEHHEYQLFQLKDFHTRQLEALLESLVERRDVLRNSHADELAALDDFYDAKLKLILEAQEKERDARRNARRDAAGQRAADDAAAPWLSGGGASDVMIGRQHGGPVSAGRRYMVGEAGPEMFVPSSSGRIEPNGSGGGTVDPRILARAIKDALEGTAMNVDGRKLGRLTVRHQPLAVTELGGRR